MRYARLIGIAALCATVAATLFISTRLLRAQAVTPTPYNPYPSGILPSNLIPSLRGFNGKFEAFSTTILHSRTHYRHRLVGQPADNSGGRVRVSARTRRTLAVRLEHVVVENTACASCHMPYAGFSAPIPSVNLTTVAYPGSYSYRVGKRDRATIHVFTHIPGLNYNTTQGAFFGGNFWDSRATGYNCRPLTPTSRSGLRLIPGTGAPGFRLHCV